MPGRGFRDLVAWQRAIDLVEQVSQLSANWPQNDAYGLSSQIRRAAVSVPANIAEGEDRGSDKAFAHHPSFAFGSRCDLETHLVIAKRVEYIDLSTVEELVEQTTGVARPLHGRMRRFA